MRKSPPKKFKKIQHKSHSDVQKAILDTLKYRRIFNCPMNIFQIWNYLIASATPNIQTFQENLARLVKEKKVIEKQNLYSLDKINPNELDIKIKHARKLLEKAQATANYLKQIPWIELVAVTGSVAAFNADKDDDIDVFIVTRENRLFLSRFFIVAVLKILRIYWNAQKPGGTICPNIMMSTKSLTWEKDKQNIYTANEISMLYPLFSRNNCYFNFMEQNSWTTKYLPNINVTSVPIKPLKKRLLNVAFNFLELAAMKIQTNYMKSKMTKEVVTKNFIHFNTHDISPNILKNFRAC